MLSKTFMALAFGTLFSLHPAHAATFNEDGELVLNNNEPVAVSGVISELNGDEFQLDYGGKDTVTIDLENWDSTDQFAELIVPGTRVTVTGIVEDNMFQAPEVDADAISLDDSNTVITVSGVTRGDLGSAVQEIEPAAGDEGSDNAPEDGALQMEKDESDFIKEQPEWSGYDGEGYRYRD